MRTENISTRFVLKDRRGVVYECSNFAARCRVLLENGQFARVVHYVNGINDCDAIRSVEEFQAKEYRDFLDWAELRGIFVDQKEYPEPLPIKHSGEDTSCSAQQSI